MPIAGEVVAASRMPNGVVTTTVTIIKDDTVELDETFSVVGMVVESGLIADGNGREFPVVFQSPLDISITSDDSKSLVFFALQPPTRFSVCWIQHNNHHGNGE